ncbi:MAG TPA: putative toxin-antitoxin system toxin component, PIN family [bacterium]|nr:putative toxin-antitoxin system toxin component, PIN family [bacterium]
MRLVLDTNVLIAAYISRGLCSEVLEACLKRHEIILSSHLETELREKLTRKFRQPKEEVEEYLGVLSLHADWVQPPVLSRLVSRDPKDDAVLATALQGKAAYLVTGDKDLLALKRFGRIQIVSPRIFWDKVAGRDEEA